MSSVTHRAFTNQYYLNPYIPTSTNIVRRFPYQSILFTFHCIKCSPLVFFQRMHCPADGLSFNTFNTRYGRLRCQQNFSGAELQKVLLGNVLRALCVPSNDWGECTCKPSFVNVQHSHPGLYSRLIRTELAHTWPWLCYTARGLYVS